MGETTSVIKRWPFGNLPHWLRHFTPWWLLDYINTHYDVCWTKVVLWKMYDGDWGRVEKMCFCHSEGALDYCGKFGIEKARELGDMRPEPPWLKQMPGETR